MKVQTPDNIIFEADNARELVILLHDSSFAPSTSDQEWMQQSAELAQMQLGRAVDIRTDTPDNFIADLIKVGLLKELV